MFSHIFHIEFQGDQPLCASFHTEAASFVQLAAARDMEPAEVQGVQQAKGTWW